MGIGIMGGTFNPVHLGHLRAAEEVAESLKLARVIFIPAAKPPHKSEGKIVPFKDRYRMLELALGGNPLFELSDLEHRRPGKSYSVETLTQLSSQLREELYFLVGLDAFLELPTWKSYRELFSLCHFVVVARPGYSPTSLDKMLQTQVSDKYSSDSQVQGFVHPSFHSVYYREVTLLDISSSNIRDLLAKGCSVRYLLPEKVEDYIHKQGLYRNSEESIKP
ncbi:MAG: nicotinate-nucleotide adenylyltransferase [Deltaproteobacteria bacterium]|nr:MAG: nicotinate-nucleotide adenylyltransferase [Deltaproteobacteria bacterium]